MNAEKMAKSLFENRIWNIAKNLLLSVLFCVGIKFLTDYDSVLYQVHKDAALAKAMVAFLVIIFILKKVRLWNIPSLIGTVALVPFSVYYLQQVSQSPDIIAIRKPWILIYWLLLMMIIDFVWYRKYKELRIEKPALVVLFVLTTALLTIFGNGTKEGITMLVVFTMLFTTVLEKEEWENAIKRFCDGWLFVSVWLIAKSFLYYYPYTTERFYGCFTNIGAFGGFLLCSMMVSIYGIYYLKQEKGIKHPMFWINLLWLLVTFAVTMMTYTVTMLIGLFFVVLALFLFARKDVSTKKVLLRLSLVIGLILLGFLVLYLASLNAREVVEYWHQKYRSDTHNIVYYFLYRFYRSFVPEVDYSGIAELGLAKYDGLLMVLNNISSARIYLWEEFSKCFNFFGNPAIGIQIGNYYAFGAHCEYVQTLYRFGYIGGGLNIALFVTGLVYFVKRYIKERKMSDFLGALWLFGMLGVWTGESQNVMYPITFMGLFLMYPVLCKFRKQN